MYKQSITIINNYNNPIVCGRSTRTYDPSKRSWYKRASSNPSKTTISTAYMDAAGVGKIITVSQVCADLTEIDVMDQSTY